MRWLPTLKRATDTDADIPVDAQISTFWDVLWARTAVYSPRLLDRVWAANRCLQLNSQQIASMPLRFYGTSSEPAWVSNPDPVWYPNGIGDAIFAAAWSIYGWGDAFLYVTARYANGYPSAWTVLDPQPMKVDLDDSGRRMYTSGNIPLDADDMVQVTRDPRGTLRGTSALRSYAAHLWAAETSAELGRSMTGENGIPNAVLKSQRKLTKDQAEALQAQWVERTSVRRGAPAVLPPDIDFEQLAFSPKDLMLLDAQEFEARVIASAFGVPPFLLNLPLTGGLTYQSPDMLVEQWWRVELRPAALRVSQALSANMLPRGSWVEFESREALAPPLLEAVKAWDLMLAKGVVTVDEYRAAVLRLPPLRTEEGSLDSFTPAVEGTGNVQPLRPALPAEVVMKQ